MLAKYVGPRTYELPLIASGLEYNQGAGLDIALEVGASTAATTRAGGTCSPLLK